MVIYRQFYCIFGYNYIVLYMKDYMICITLAYCWENCWLSYSRTNWRPSQALQKPNQDRFWGTNTTKSVLGIPQVLRVPIACITAEPTDAVFAECHFWGFHWHIWHVYHRVCHWFIQKRRDSAAIASTWPFRSKPQHRNSPHAAARGARCVCFQKVAFRMPCFASCFLEGTYRIKIYNQKRSQYLE